MSPEREIHAFVYWDYIREHRIIVVSQSKENYIRSEYVPNTGIEHNCSACSLATFPKSQGHILTTIM